MQIEGMQPIGVIEILESRRLTAEELSEGEWVAGKLGYPGWQSWVPFTTGRIHKEGEMNDELVIDAQGNVCHKEDAQETAFNPATVGKDASA
jgi:hypothetical protein